VGQQIRTTLPLLKNVNQTKPPAVCGQNDSEAKIRAEQIRVQLSAELPLSV
jgi:hypothetical protein